MLNFLIEFRGKSLDKLLRLSEKFQFKWLHHQSPHTEAKNPTFHIATVINKPINEPQLFTYPGVFVDGAHSVSQLQVSRNFHVFEHRKQ